MRLFIALAAVVVSASAFPAELGGANRTADGIGRAIGMATFGDGTNGGAGGAVWTVWDSWALRDAVSGNERGIVYVRGRISLDQLFAAPPGVRIDVGAHKSNIGAFL